MNTRKLTFSSLLISIGVISSHIIWLPIGASKCFPIQHLINVLSAIFLGPFYAVANAFVISLLRNILGTGSLLAFPGSMIGALLAGLLYQKFQLKLLAVTGEVIGTGIIGALLAYPIASFVMGKNIAGLFFIIPFSISSIVGSLIAYLMICALEKNRIFENTNL